jgi:hypothetical protein
MNLQRGKGFSTALAEMLNDQIPKWYYISSKFFYLDKEIQSSGERKRSRVRNPGKLKVQSSQKEYN